MTHSRDEDRKSPASNIPQTTANASRYRTIAPAQPSTPLLAPSPSATCEEIHHPSHCLLRAAELRDISWSSPSSTSRASSPSFSSVAIPSVSGTALAHDAVQRSADKNSASPTPDRSTSPCLLVTSFEADEARTSLPGAAYDSGDLNGHSAIVAPLNCSRQSSLPLLTPASLTSSVDTDLSTCRKPQAEPACPPA